MTSGSLGQALKAGLIAAVQVAAFDFIGSELAANFGSRTPAFGTTGYVVKVASHAALGCLSAAAMGGKCGQGAAGAAASAAASPFMPGGLLGIGASAAVGGLAAVAAGGSFKQGAMNAFADAATTAAFGYMYNARGWLYSRLAATHGDDVAKAMIANARAEGVEAAWKQEAALARAGEQTSHGWTSAQLEELKNTGKVADYVGHHRNSVSANELAMARNPDNIEFMSTADHIAYHQKNGHNLTGYALLERSAFYRAISGGAQLLMPIIILTSPFPWDTTPAHAPGR